MRARRISPHLTLLAAPALAIVLMQGWSTVRLLYTGDAPDQPLALRLFDAVLPLLDAAGAGIHLTVFPLLCVLIWEGLDLLTDRRRQARLRRLLATRHVPLRRVVRRLAALGIGLGVFLLLSVVLTAATIALFFALRPSDGAMPLFGTGLFLATMLGLHWLAGVAVVAVYRRVSLGPHEHAPQLRRGVGAKRLRIQDPEALSGVADRIGNQRLYADSILYDQDEGRLTVPLEIARRDRSAPPHPRWLGLAEQTDCPLVVGELVLRNVRSFRTEDPAFVGIYAVDRIAWAPPLLTIEAAPGLAILAELDGFDVELVLTRAPVGRCRVTRWLGILETEWRRREPAAGV